VNAIYVIIAGGVTLLLLLIFETLLGRRKIRFKGALHGKVHRWTAYTMVALAVVHGVFAVGTLVFGWF
jgi:hypothetical protein